jgi:preprotein translocase subunit SecY
MHHFLGFGGGFGDCSIFGLGLRPYLEALIIMSCVKSGRLFPALDHHEDEAVQNKVYNLCTRKLTLILAVLKGCGSALAIALDAMRRIDGSLVMQDYERRRGESSLPG